MNMKDLGLVPSVAQCVKDAVPNKLKGRCRLEIRYKAVLLY